MSTKLITIIIPSFRDSRIINAIKSARDFDDSGVVRLLIMDGGSGSTFCENIAPLLKDGDVFLTEPDQGIFDALNKGLQRCETPYIGWLGSDDFFSGEVTASDVVRVLSDVDLYVGNTEFFSGTRVVRRISATMCRYSWGRRLGFHNPHYSTFGRANVLRKYFFDPNNRGADIGYFLKVFAAADGIRTSRKVFTYMAAGGFSNKSVNGVLKVNIDLMSYYGILTPIVISLKLGYKFSSRIWHFLRPRHLPRRCIDRYLSNPFD
jgi:glycosyltransferase involved in cell wall biosynthesis